jgi:hypothetical protein
VTGRVPAIAAVLRAHGREIESRVEGTSMGATLPESSQVRIRCGEPDADSRDAIVAFLAGSRLVSHRVVHQGRRGRASQYLITRGDGRLLPDPPVRRGDVLGTVTGVWIGDGWVPPGGRPAQPPLRRLAVGLLGLLAKGAVEVDVALAERILRGLRAAHAALRRPGPHPPETP